MTLCRTPIKIPVKIQLQSTCSSARVKSQGISIITVKQACAVHLELYPFCSNKKKHMFNYKKEVISLRNSPDVKKSAALLKIYNLKSKMAA